MTRRSLIIDLLIWLQFGMAKLSFSFVFISKCAVIVFLLLPLSSSTNIVLHIDPPQPVLFITKGTSLSLNCTAISNNDNISVSLEWQVDHQSTGNDVRFIQNDDSALLQIGNITYFQRGKYTCVAKDGTSHTTQAERTVEINVGDAPPYALPPILEHVYGYPPVETFISYILPATTMSAYPLTIRLLLSTLSVDNFCMDPTNPAFQVVEQRIQTVPSNKDMTFHANVSSSVKMLFPSFPWCNSRVDCTTLCSAVVISNSFGCTHSLHYWDIKTEAKCGKVDKPLVLQTTKDSAVVGWTTPKYMANSTKTVLYYWLWCEPCTKKKIRIRSLLRSNRNSWNGTIAFLTPDTPYHISVTCSFERKFDNSAEPSKVTVRTKEGVPLIVPTFQELRWLSEASSVLKGTALIVWQLPIKDNISLGGKLRSYHLTYQRLNDPNAERVRKVVGPDILRLEIPGLPMSNYSLTIEACTSVGCGNTSRPYYLLALVDTTNDINREVNADEEIEDNSKWPPGVIGALSFGGSAVIIVGIVLVLVYRKNRSRSSNDPLPGGDIRSTSTQELCTENDADFPTAEPNAEYNYASANCESPGS